MQIKTPVQFTAFNDLVDADGETFLQLDPASTVGPETKQAIIDAFEDAARYRFLMAAFDNPHGPEALAGAMQECDDEEMTGARTTELVDKARAQLAAATA